jgi:hypothetical protein
MQKAGAKRKSPPTESVSKNEQKRYIDLWKTAARKLILYQNEISET